MAENESAAADDAVTEAETETSESETEVTDAAATAEATTEATAEATAEAAAPEAEAAPEEITYHAVEKDGQVTAIWEMQGRKHLRTIDPRSRQGQEILRLYTAEHGD